MAIRAFSGRRRADGPSLAIRRLFCFPYAGAGATVFRQWPDHLPPDVELCLPCLPGRDARVDEPPACAMGPLAASLAREMLPWLSVPYALFGHSMGAFLAFDVARELSELGRPPDRLFVSGQRGPALPYAQPPIFALPDEEFLAGILARYQNIPEAILKEKELMAVLLRVLRADFTLVEDYRYRDRGKLTCPITAFAGETDTQVSREQMEAWASETTGKFRLHLLPGGHFFLNERREELLSLLRQDLAS
jgi:surfactin synthase thioesterase subunit